ncbi:helix-turn-helix domain-containing protein [Anaerosinus gibii]|uniref:Helix-turn-helix domain-containing protein n=1 Tax=Selenobaculum gibii TaxID=3054208 RepID=A0A9Y2EV83_9FIRM|nr:helix-turn-helix domain-containing protein [Selenobaculum gbiensis]WIW70669.1 helix-turn-helix domain-containing protein [Selenobaculum gbiensis]
MFNQYEDLVTVEELTEMLNIGKNSAYKLLASGNLKAFRINRIWKIPRQSVTDYVYAQTKSPATN